MTRYHHELALLGLDDSHIASSSGRARWWTVPWWPLAKVVVATPVAVVGTVIHIVPYTVVQRIARDPRQ